MMSELVKYQQKENGARKWRVESERNREMKKLRETWFVRVSFIITAFVIELVESIVMGSKRFIQITVRALERTLPSWFSRFTGRVRSKYQEFQEQAKVLEADQGDVPGWVLVVLMTTGLVTAVWAIAAPRLSTILRNSLDAMNGIR